VSDRASAATSDSQRHLRTRSTQRDVRTIDRRGDRRRTARVERHEEAIGIDSGAVIELPRTDQRLKRIVRAAVRLSSTRPIPTIFANCSAIIREWRSKRS